MKTEGLSEAAISAFRRNYDALAQGVTVRTPSQPFPRQPAPEPRWPCQ